MIKRYYFSANWRKKDIDFLNSLNLTKMVEIGYDSFTVEDEGIYKKINTHFNMKDGLLSKQKPEGYLSLPATVIFEKEEFESSNKYVLSFTGESVGEPMPIETYPMNTFSFEFESCLMGREQKANFRMTPPKLKKNQSIFTLHDFDIIFLKTELYEKVFEPFGLMKRAVINHKTNKTFQEYVQLIIPEAKSKLNIKGNEFGGPEVCKECERIQYSLQTLDFFPDFETEFEFNICRTQEEFIGGLRRIVVSRNFLNTLLENDILEFNQNHLIPVK